MPDLAWKPGPPPLNETKGCARLAPHKTLPPAFAVAAIVLHSETTP